MNQDPVSPKATNRRGSDITGRTLGNYVLIRRLGRGGMANVYLAHQMALDRPVAIKVLKPELAVDKAYVKRFHREAQAAAALNQANIVQIYEVGEIDGIHFIAQEYVRGQNLRQYLNRNTVVEPILAVSILRQVAAALQKASEGGVIHRDIKPENIMLASNGEVKVADFGLARVVDDQRADLTQIGITMGTPLYMSPEQAEGSRVDARSDLYSLGITAWHMFAGRPPFEGENALTIAVKHVKEDMAPLGKIRPDLPDELCAIVHKLASKKPADRFQDPGQLIRELRTLEFDDIADWEKLTEKLAVDDPVAGLGASTTRQSRLEVTRQLETIMSGQFRAWWKSPRLAIGLLLVLLAGGIAGVVYAWQNPPGDPLATEIQIDGRVPRMESAEAQYFYAYDQAANTDNDEYEEKLWQAVIMYFGPAPDQIFEATDLFVGMYVNKTHVRLGEFYLLREEYERAESEFELLADLDENERELRLTGIAGLAIIYDFLKDNERLQDLVSGLQNVDLQELESELLENRTRNMLERRFPGLLGM